MLATRPPQGPLWGVRWELSRVKLLPESLDLPAGFLNGTGIVDDPVGLFGLFGGGPLGRKAALGIFTRETVAVHETIDLPIAAGSHDDDTVHLERIGPGRVQQQRNVNQDDRVWTLLADLFYFLLDPATDRRVGDSVQPAAGSCVGEDDLTKALPVDGAVWIQNLLAERFDDLPVDFGSGHNDFPGYLVGFNHDRPELSEDLRGSTHTCRDASRQADDFHRDS